MIRPIQHLYPDELPEPRTVRCYSLDELYAEKIRAMGERGRPRDLYDIVFLLDHPDLANHGALIRETLIAKCESKGVPIPTLEGLEASPNHAELISEWESMLGHQLPTLPPFEHYWDRLPELFEWLAGAELERLNPVTGGTGETVWSPSPDGWSWGAGVALEPIRFAGANRLCVDLGYQGSVRRVEPYSLRVTRDGNLLLYAIRRRDRQLRSYRVDRITSVSVTTEPFRPTHVVEFRPTGPTFVPPVSSAPRWRASAANSYRVRCPYCGKTFTRKRPGTKLNTHKTPTGGRCVGSGRMGRRL